MPHFLCKSCNLCEPLCTFRILLLHNHLRASLHRRLSTCICRVPREQKDLVLNIFFTLKLHSGHTSLKFRESRQRLSAGQFRLDNIVPWFFTSARLYSFNQSFIVTHPRLENSSQKFWYSSCDIVIPPFNDE